MIASFKNNAVVAGPKKYCSLVLHVFEFFLHARYASFLPFNEICTDLSHISYFVLILADHATHEFKIAQLAAL